MEPAVESGTVEAGAVTIFEGPESGVETADNSSDRSDSKSGVAAGCNVVIGVRLR